MPLGIFLYPAKFVTLFTRVWIEIFLFPPFFFFNYVTLFTRVWIEIRKHLEQAKKERVTLFTRVWIEIKEVEEVKKKYGVTLFTRVWIEILDNIHSFDRFFCHSLYESVNWNKFKKIWKYFYSLSLSLRECELKYRNTCKLLCFLARHSLYESVNWNIAKCFRSALILGSLSLRECELKSILSSSLMTMVSSLSLRECELKSKGRDSFGDCCEVTLFTRVWIEIHFFSPFFLFSLGHSLYESVNWNRYILERAEKITGHSLYESVNWNV